MIGKHADQEKLQYIDGLGEILFKRSSRARRLRLSAHPRFGIRVTMPKRVSYKAAMSFAINNSIWISKQKAKMKLHEDQLQPRRELLATLDRREAAELLISETEALAKLHGFSFQRVRIGQQKTLWGSCSSKGNINLNIQLAILPESLRQYVILHEMVHLQHPHHGPSFWQKLSRYIDNPQSLRKQLKQIPIVTPID